MEHRGRWWARGLLVVAAGLPLSGCLSFEVLEVQITRDPDLGGSGRARYSMTMRNIASDGEKDAEADFRDLIKAWQSDEYLIDRVSDGCYVQRRDLSVERGVLVGREEGLLAHLRGMDLDTLALGDSTFLRLRVAKASVEATTGRIVRLEGETSVLWPADVRQIRYVLRMSDFRKAADLVPRFEALRKTHQGRGRP